MENKFLSNKKIINENKKSLIANYIHITLCIIYMCIIINITGLKGFIYNNIKYLTNWGYVINFFYSVLKIINKKNKKFMDVYFNVSFNVEFNLCLLYWLIIAKYITIEDLGLFGWLLCHSIHVFPWIFVLAEFFLDENIKFKYCNAIYIIALLLLYELNDLFFTIILKDEPYPMSKEEKNILIPLAIAISIIIHFCFTYLKKSYLNVKITFLNQYII